MAMLGFMGVTPMDTNVAAVTVSMVDPDTPPSEAVIMAEPGISAVTSSVAPVAWLTAPTVMDEEFQVTASVKSCAELSL